MIKAKSSSLRKTSLCCSTAAEGLFLTTLASVSVNKLDGKAPSAIQLFPSGPKLATVDGRKFALSDPARVIAAFEARAEESARELASAKHAAVTPSLDHFVPRTDYDAALARASTLSAEIAAFSSSVLRCLGAGTRAASTI